MIYLTVKEISEQFNTSKQAVQQHLSGVKKKMGIEFIENNSKVEKILIENYVKELDNYNRFIKKIRFYNNIIIHNLLDKMREPKRTENLNKFEKMLSNDRD